MPELLTVDVRVEPGSLRLCLTGDLDLSSVDTLRVCLEAIDDGVRRVIIDLRDLDFLDSTGLNLFVQTHRRFGPELRELVIANPGAGARRVLDVSGVAQVISVIDEVPRAAVREPA